MSNFNHFSDFNSKAVVKNKHILLIPDIGRFNDEKKSTKKEEEKYHLATF